MKKSSLFLILFIGVSFSLMAQQPMTISPGIVINSSASGASGLRLTNLTSSSTASTTPTKVLSVDASGNIILGNAASGSGSTPAVNIPVYTNGTARTTAIPTATTGMLTYNSASTGPEIFNGSSWIPLNYWTFNSARNVVVSPSGGAVGIEANTFVSQAPSTVASPVIALAGANHVIRYARSGPELDEFALTQETTTGTQQSAASIAWKHYDNSPTPIGTTLFGYAAGTFTINGFTKLGDEATSTTSGVTKSSPAIKTILLTGSLTSSANPETAASLTTTIAHGLNFTKIVDTKVLIASSSAAGGRLVSESFTDNRPSGAITGYQFSTITDATNIYIVRNNGNSGNIAPNTGSGVTANYRILISYIP